MPLSFAELADLPSPFYRVAVKAIIVDEQERLLTILNHHGEAEIPGGGWEHNEAFEDALQRELTEEIGVRAHTISPPQFVFQSTSSHGWRVVRVFARAVLEEGTLRGEDERSSFRWVSKAEFLSLKFDQTDAPVVEYVDKIWTEES